MNNIVETSNYKATFNDDTTVSVVVKSNEMVDAINELCGMEVIKLNEQMTIGKLTFNKLVKRIKK